MHKKGLSLVVRNFLLGLIVIVLIGGIWVVIENIIERSAGEINLERFDAGLGMEYEEPGESGNFNSGNNIRCTSWEECGADYKIQDILYNKEILEGVQERICFDSLNELKTIEKKECNLSIPIYTKKVQWCFEEYIEIYEKETDKLVGKIKKSDIEEIEDLDKIDIFFIMTEFKGYCDYCFDDMKNYDEEGIDCGGSCPACVEKERFFDWLLWLQLILWLLLVGFLLSFLYREGKKLQFYMKNEEKGKT